MRVWTIQPLGVWEALQRDRLLYVDRAKGCDPDFAAAYDWMAEQMRRRFGGPEGAWPWWGWHRWNGVPRPKPDLRAVTWQYPKGETHVCIELELSECEVLLSGFDDWHSVMIGSYLASCQAEDEAFEAECAAAGVPDQDALKVEPFRSRVLRSWDRIFNLDEGDGEWRTHPHTREVQATFWSLDLAQVRGIKVFNGRGAAPGTPV